MPETQAQATVPVDPGASLRDAAGRFVSLLSLPKDDTGEEGEPAAAEATPAEETAPLEEAGESAETQEPVVEESAEEPSPEPTTIRVRLDGKEVALPVEEVAKGYQRQADYTRKTQELAKHREAIQAEQAATRETREQLSQTLAKQLETLQALVPKAPDWDTLRVQNPTEYPTIHADWTRYQEAIQSKVQEKADLDRKIAADRATQARQMVEAERGKLLEAVPEWQDAKALTKAQADIAEYAKSYGYTDDDLALVTDHRLMLILRDAAAYKAAQAARPKVQAKVAAVKAATPGPSTPSVSRQTEMAQMRKRLASSGRVEDAQSLISAALGDNI